MSSSWQVAKSERIDGNFFSDEVIVFGTGMEDKVVRHVNGPLIVTKNYWATFKLDAKVM